MRRIDYVGVPCVWAPTSCEAWVSTNIDPSITKTDHLAACVDYDPLDADGTPTRSCLRTPRTSILVHCSTVRLFLHSLTCTHTLLSCSGSLLMFWNLREPSDPHDRTRSLCLKTRGSWFWRSDMPGHISQNSTNVKELTCWRCFLVLGNNAPLCLWSLSPISISCSVCKMPLLPKHWAPFGIWAELQLELYVEMTSVSSRHFWLKVETILLLVMWSAFGRSSADPCPNSNNGEPICSLPHWSTWGTDCATFVWPWDGRCRWGNGPHSELSPATVANYD